MHFSRISLFAALAAGSKPGFPSGKSCSELGIHRGRKQGAGANPKLSKQFILARAHTEEEVNFYNAKTNLRKQILGSLLFFLLATGFGAFNIYDFRLLQPCWHISQVFSYSSQGLWLHDLKDYELYNKIMNETSGGFVIVSSSSILNHSMDALLLRKYLRNPCLVHCHGVSFTMYHSPYMCTYF